MASRNFIFLVILSLISCTLQDVTNNKVDSKDESPLADVAKEILKEKNMENIGGMVNGFLQSGGAKQIMEGVLQNLASGENSNQILDSLGSFLNGGDDEARVDEVMDRAYEKSDEDVNQIDIMSGIGSLVGALQGAGGGAGGNGNPSGALLKGLGSLLQGGNNQGNVNQMDIMSGIGSLVGALQGAGGGEGRNGNPSGALLQGLGSLLQGGGNNQGGGGNTLALLQGLGSLLASSTQENGKKEANGNNAALLQGLGAILGAATAGNQGGGENNGGALLQGLGSLLSGGQGGQGGINPEMIGNVLSMFSNSDDDEDNEKKPLKGPPKKATREAVKTKKANTQKDNSDGLEKIKGTKSASKKRNFNLPFDRFSLIMKMAKTFGGPKLKPYLGSVEDIISLYKDTTNKKKPFNSDEFKQRIMKIYKKNKKPLNFTKIGQHFLKIPYLGSVEDIISLYKDTTNKKKPFNSDEFKQRIMKIYKKNKNLISPTLKSQYIAAVEDIVSLYKDTTNKKKPLNFDEYGQRIMKIYEKNKKLISSVLKSMDTSKSNDDSFDLGSILNLASTFLNQGNSGKASSAGSFMDYLPMIMNTINSFTGPEAQERAYSHSEHSWSLPPVLEKIHVYYDNFLNSEMGKNIIDFISSQPTLKVFRDEKGNFSYDKFEELVENHSFRRHWIQQVVEQLISLLQVASDEKTYNQYIEMGIMFANSFLQKFGFPNEALLNSKKPATSITKFANYAAKQYLGTEIDTREYVEPTVLYVQDLLKMARKSVTPGAQSKELTDKLTETINMEMIEPITRVNRAFRFTKAQPQCDKYVFCLVNQEVTSFYESLPSLKKALYKASSLIAGWFISSNTGTSYWDLYAIVTENKNCNDFYHESCDGFHDEEFKATTEYVHNEL